MNKWKEASSLIISATSAKCQHMKKLPLNKTPSVEFENSQPRPKFQLLALKKTRNVQTQTPQVCVFPGGSVSTADSVKGWEQLLLTFGLNLNVLSSTIVHGNMLNLPIFSDINREEDIPRWLSLRITAIRETFEECGLLLCKTEDSIKMPGKLNNISKFTSNHFQIDDIDSWRVKVLDDPYQFLSLCLHFNCYPDIESLCFWNNWLTPSHLSERYDAVFFLTNLDTLDVCRGSPDYREIESTEWLEPEELLLQSQNGEILLKPPQWFEINSLKNIQDCTCLSEISNQRSRACLRWMPVRVIAVDGEISLLPGDMMYPNALDLFRSSPIFRKQETMDSLRCEVMHRMEHSGARIVLIDTRSGQRNGVHEESHP